ncbi:SBDS family rRNA metabolism protein [Trichophyton interdigitale MR816]|uniref:SBDS family rRNA metabolism protein n=1 Tax=Trichophyton interdigitale (strain MR816) TaxID=1215338 RepID=A0A059J078_TRIIM|nr:SBDS family rRNA metabolism protein [Trichophyton interdigitale H6]KDB20912.1 SBDS family rRNA metabolism protein [Trichophyton interdigitale MR816]
MPMIMQPSNQIKFTNVSIVRLKKGKKRYELACYKNKLLEYRSGAETDLDNVLQIPTVFLSVSRGHTAPTAELAKSFGKDYKTEDVIQEILRKGEVQVGEKERRDILDRVEKEVLEIVSARLVDPVSKRVYTTGMIGKALDQLSAASGQQQQQQQQQQHETAEVDGDEEIAKKTADLTLTPRKPLWTGVTTSKSAKIQALDAMKALIAWQPIPVMRARMRLRITCPTSILKQPVRTAPSSTGASGNSNSAPSSSKKEKGKGKKGKKAADDDEEDDQSKASASPSTPAPAAAAGTVKDRILSYLEQIESQEVIGGDEWEVLGFAEPGAFKGLGEFIGGETKGKGRVEVMDMAVTHEE